MSLAHQNNVFQNVEKYWIYVILHGGCDRLWITQIEKQLKKEINKPNSKERRQYISCSQHGTKTEQTVILKDTEIIVTIEIQAIESQENIRNMRTKYKVGTSLFNGWQH